MMMRTRVVLAVLSICLLSTAGVDAGSGGHFAARPMSTTVGMGYVQGTPMYAGCNDCGNGCGACSACCPGILPAVVGGIDHLLKAVFCGHRFCGASCGVSSCDGCAAGPSCGCDVGYDGVIEEGTVVPTSPSDPFIDDTQQPAATPQARHYKLWNMPQPSAVRHRTAPGAATRATVRSTGTPRTLEVSQAQPIPAVKSSAKTTVVRGIKPTVRATSNESTDLRLPRNPLRD